MTATTRQLPRPTAGPMPTPRTPGAVWHAWESTYTLQQGGAIRARVVIDGDDTRVGVMPMPLGIAHHVCADIAAVTSWLATGAR